MRVELIISDLESDVLPLNYRGNNFFNLNKIY